MSFKDKLILSLLSIVTLGIYPIVAFSKKPKEAKSTLSVDKVVTDTNKLTKFLGTKTNIAGAEFTQTKIKVFINDKSKVDAEAIKNLKGVSGIVLSSKYATIIVGKQAKELSKALIK